MNGKKIKTEILVLGAGPGGYAAAFYAADMGKKVTLIDRDKNLGGVCLNRGCIPSKALLHAVRLLEDAKSASQFGIEFGKPSVDLDKLRSWKNETLAKLSGGVAFNAKKRGVDVMTGRGYFESSNVLRLETEDGQKFIEFEKAIIAVGSRPAMPAAFDLGNPRIMTSDQALEIAEIPESLLVVGGGYIGMELSTVYAALGSKVTVVEAGPEILSGADADLIRPVKKYAESHFKEVRVNAKVQKMATSGKQIKVTMDSGDELYDRVLVSIGRTPNSADLGLENTKVQLTDKGFIKANTHQQTDDPSIFAIGDIVGGLMLAHKASKEARIAVEVICGERSAFENIIIPAVVFTHPEVAWCGLTEAEAKSKNIAIEVAKFPWSASGRAMTLGDSQGLTKLIIEPGTDRILGVGIVGHNAGDLISEGVLAIEMGATAQDIALTVHPHPTLGETMMEAAELFYGHSSHVYSPKK